MSNIAHRVTADNRAGSGIAPPLRVLMVLMTAWLAAPVAAYDWDAHLWRDRLLILVAPAPDDTGAARQLAEIRRRDDAVQDRSLRIVQVYAHHGSVDAQSLDITEVRDLRQRLNAAADARELILVGLDGGIKRREPLDDAQLSDLFLEIDGMPMRQAEIRAKRRAGLAVTPP